MFKPEATLSKQMCLFITIFSANKILDRFQFQRQLTLIDLLRQGA